MRHVILLALLAGVAVGEPASPEGPPLHFNHASHKDRGLATDECATCHRTDLKGTISPPAAIGHYPCLNGACHNEPKFTHAGWFVATGPTAKAKNPELFAKATRFCLGCHDGTDAPAPASKPTTAAVLKAFLSEREFHVTMKSPDPKIDPKMLGHFTHVQTAGGNCVGCHTVGGKTDVTPGHAQCQTCHGAGTAALHAMSDCGKCHVPGGRAAAYPDVSRPHTDVRQCGSERHVQSAKNQHLALDQVTCFSHDKVGHQFHEGKDGKPDLKDPVECSMCHALVVEEKLDLPALHTEQIVPNAEAKGHALCGSCHHHSADVFKGSGTKCLKCHADHARKEWQ